MWNSAAAVRTYGISPQRQPPILLVMSASRPTCRPHHASAFTSLALPELFAFEAASRRETKAP
ncbi:hypothetical protein EIB18_17175 [Caulobacter vibrioides]|uniref:Uncharacterized protein n=1 Tax=Caulobacter vibrioides (strain NA1000 / CB15N) TaxID=565050 RepID=A0A0H3CC37_CAUVN|nr:hypothetical protein [Caulobacter vibrioides]YP_002518721.1 hypothetical protein CCNA_03349 [Caulobacter vibrioides NA1000]ACL96813.1 hypothetical protein CCNA_03349 [Caulobacter vibrioides NA1000]ATC26123.1 hypothetical protein CA608_17080 [Caulobacter vibrioides]ATC30067.1 hypothetical protein CA607_17430 [Caulobacter vibrioides]AZH14263.1 hypothetical protein EIB18_17175 [Caulobacter vibrioides]PLR11023.1 hypothetical protein CVUC_13200 [Caulobacter vibrioides]